MNKTRYFEALAGVALAHSSTLREVNASAAGELREVTGEDILAAVEAAGGEVLQVERDPATGVITSIEASGQRPLFDEDDGGDERGAVLSSVEAAGLPQKIVGDLAQTSVTPDPVATTGSTTSASATVTVASATGIALGQKVAGTGIPANTTVQALAGTTVTLSANATATGSGVALTFTGQAQVIGLNEWTLSWKRKTVDATTTDDAAYESSLGSTSSWTVKAKYMFLVGDTSQANFIIGAMQSPKAPQYWNFFPDVTQGHPAYSGYAFLDSIDISSGSGKLVGLDCSLKGTGPLTIGTQLAPVASTNTVTGQQAMV